MILNMKKNIRILAITLLFFGILTIKNNVYGASASISASKKEIAVGENTTISANINSTETWELKLETIGGKLEGNTNDADAYGKEETKTGVISGKFSADKEGTYTITLKGYVAGSDLKKHEINQSTKITVKANSNNSGGTSNSGSNNNTDDGGLPSENNPVTGTKSQDNSLKSLSVSVGTLSPKFSPRTTRYTVDVGEEVTSIKISATKNHEKAELSGTGTKQLKPGVNTFEVIVKAESGSVQPYTIIVNKPEEKKEAILKLSSLVIKGVNTDRELIDLEFEPEFSEDVYSYKLDVEENIDSLSIEAMPKEEGTIVEILGNENLVFGENIVKIQVKSEDGEQVAEYQIIVNKKQPTQQVVAPVDEIPQAVEKNKNLLSEYSIPIVVFTATVAILGGIFAIVEYRHSKREKEENEDRQMNISNYEELESSLENYEGIAVENALKDEDEIQVKIDETKSEEITKDAQETIDVMRKDNLKQSKKKGKGKHF